MNKRFFTLMAAVLLAGAPLSGAFAENQIEAESIADDVLLSNGAKFVIKSGSTYVTVTEVTNDNTKVAYATFSADNATISSAAVFEVVNLQESALGVSFSLNVNGKPYAVLSTGGGIATNTAKTDIKTIFTTATSTATNGKYLLKNVALQVVGGSTLSGYSTQTISLDYDDDNLNFLNNSSTTFSFDATSLEGDVFQAVTPYTIANASAELDITSTVIGTIFVKGAAADVKKFVNPTTAVADRKAALKKLNVVYVKNELWGLNTQGTGEGYKVVTISGADFYKDENAAVLDNAAFTSIVEADQLNKEGDVILTIHPKLGTTANPVDVEVTVAAVKASASDTKAYVTTVANVDTETYPNSSQFKTIINPTLGANSFFAASEFLKAGAPSVYNIYFTSGNQSTSKDITEHHKYLVYGSTSSWRLETLPANDVDLHAPLAQWIVTKFDGKYTLKLANRETGSVIELKLQAKDEAGVYTITGGTSANIYVGDNSASVGSLPDYVTLIGRDIKLIPTTATKTDGYLNLSKEELEAGVKLMFSGKDANIGEKSFYVATDGEASPALYPSLNVADAKSFDIAKVKYSANNSGSLEMYTDYAYIDATGKAAVKAKGDTLVIPTYVLSYKKDETTTEYVGVNFNLSTTEANQAEFIIRQTMDGSYVISQGSTSAPAFTNDNRFGANWGALGIQNARTITNTAYFYAPAAANFANLSFVINDNSDKTTLEAEPRYVTFDNFRGSVSFEENENGILEGILSAEPMTFYLDTADSDAKTPSFYISRGIVAAEEEAPATKADEAAIKMRNFMFFPVDSATIFDEGSAVADTNWDYILEGTEDELKAIFRPAAILAEDTLATVVDGKEVTVVAKDADASKDQVNGLNRFQFGICLADEDYEGYYIIYPKADKSKYLYSLNGILGYTEDPYKALVVTLGEGDATANEAIEAESGVQVIAGQGVVTVQGAAGKVITVANILGQTIANQVAASDNVTIAAPAGVIVVAVDGEATKVIVK